MERYVVAIDQSTSASKVFLVNAHGEIVKRISKNHQQFYPKSGWVEHDAEEIFHNVREGIASMVDGLKNDQISALGISNQRETVVLWERATGKPVCSAIVWQDVRGESLCEELRQSAEMVLQKTGLMLSAYYSAAKAATVLQDCPEIAEMARKGDLCIGTMDSFLLYRLTGGRCFCTDVSNASRTQLCNIHTLCWDEELCGLFGIPMQCLPEIKASDADFGTLQCEELPAGVPITGVMGDSHAALFGQGCLSAGMTKATFGTGSSVMMNVGSNVVVSQNGLSSSVGFGFRGQTCYVLEGNVTCSGDTLCWLRNEAGLIQSIDEVEEMAASVPDSGGVMLVPAFSGLGAPYFDSNARAALIGMNRATSKAHIVRAALESVAYQDADVIEAMTKDTGAMIAELRVDGGPTKNSLLMQILADLLGCRVQCASNSELSALGAAYMAGLSTGLYKEFADITSVRGEGYEAVVDAKASLEKMDAWRIAVQRCRSSKNAADLR